MIKKYSDKIYIYIYIILILIGVISFQQYIYIIIYKTKIY
jgi:hypothetical protein